jgi:hypothetical protein
MNPISERFLKDCLGMRWPVNRVVTRIRSQNPTASSAYPAIRVPINATP